METLFSFDEEVLKKALKNIYSKDFHPLTEIEENLFEATWETMNNATDKGFGPRKPDDPDYDFYREIRMNNAVFAAFKVHRAQNDMAALLLDENGKLRPFEQWLKLVMPIADHQMVDWMRTEYDTAVIRAHQAADWRQFEREKDILPNLKWMPSTSVHPGADTEYSGEPYAPSMIRSGTSTDRGIGGTASVRSRQRMKRRQRYREADRTTSRNRDWKTIRERTQNFSRTNTRIRRMRTGEQRRQWTDWHSVSRK